MKKIILAAAAVAMLSGTAGAALANEVYNKVDTNKDGVISKAESHAFNEARFNEIDTNKDGNITQQEREAHRAVVKEKRAERKAAKAAKASTSAGKATAQ